MDILAQARSALEMMATGRQALSSIVDAVRDGRAALDTKQMGELNAILAQEKTETEAAHNALQRAIQAAQSK